LWLPGDLDAAVEVPVEEREVDERRRDGAELDHVEPRRPKALDQRGGVRVRREPAVAADADALAHPLGHERAVRTPEQPRELRVEIAIRDAADVVLAKDRRIQFNTSMWCFDLRFFAIQSRNRASMA
jgi:hypothetical protein